MLPVDQLPHPDADNQRRSEGQQPRQGGRFAVGRHQERSAVMMKIPKPKSVVRPTKLAPTASSATSRKLVIGLVRKFGNSSDRRMTVRMEINYMKKKIMPNTITSIPTIIKVQYSSLAIRTSVFDTIQSTKA